MHALGRRRQLGRSVPVQGFSCSCRVLAIVSFNTFTVNRWNYRCMKSLRAALQPLVLEESQLQALLPGKLLQIFIPSSNRNGAHHGIGDLSDTLRAVW